MTYGKISNNPYERERVTHHHVWWNNAFSEEELNLFEDICNKEDLEDATTIGATDQNFVKNIRRSKVKFFGKNDTTNWIFERFNFVIKSLNDQFYNFNLNGYGSFQYTVYDANDKGTYNWHMDTLLSENSEFHKNNSTRKLTLVMPLSRPGIDFTGGEFQINVGNQEQPITIDVYRGKIIVFPSFVIHRVAPVATGIRKSIVIWVEGPKFI